MSITAYETPDTQREQTVLLMDPVNSTRMAPESVQAKASTFAHKWSGYTGTELQHYQADFNEL